MSIHTDAEKESARGSFGYSDLELIKFMFGYANQYRREILVTLLYMILFSASTVVGPLILAAAITFLQNNGVGPIFNVDLIDKGFINPMFNFIQGQFPSLEPIIIYSLLIGVLYLSAQLITFYSSYKQRFIIGTVSIKAAIQLQYELFSHLQELDMSYHDKNEVGRIMSRVTSDVGAIRQFIGGSIVQNFVNLITLLAVLVVIVQLDWVMSLISITLMIPVYFLGQRSRKLARPRRKESRKDNSILMATLAESIAGIKVTKGLGQEKANIKSFQIVNDQRRRSTIHAIDINAYFFPTMLYFSSIATAVIMLVGGYRVMTGILSLGLLVAFINYNTIMFRPVVILGNLYQQLQDALTGAERVLALFETKTKVPRNSEFPAIPALKGDVTFDHLTFKYEKGNPIYDDFNLQVPANQTIAIVGHTGAGKTTIINILSRLYEFQKGNLYLDEYEVRDYNLDSIRDEVVSVPQDFYVFSRSIKYNLQLGNPQATEEQMWKVLNVVGLDEFVKRLPDKLKTPLQERGGRLSTGQRQLLIFASALLANPKILILDEATANIDVFTEIQIQKSLEYLLQNRTSFIIAHRLSTIREADRILVIEDGEIVESGTHEDLVRTKGKYFSLIEHQMKLAAGKS